ncbi:hypothetical protein HYW84_01480 [Candidatus Peregrinibacteria bacterium]|nr:hypothetical protein [Candidatus Peregrinibacteria bacterium]
MNTRTLYPQKQFSIRERRLCFQLDGPESAEPAQQEAKEKSEKGNKETISKFVGVADKHIGDFFGPGVGNTVGLAAEKFTQEYMKKAGEAKIANQDQGQAKIKGSAEPEVKAKGAGSDQYRPSIGQAKAGAEAANNLSSVKSHGEKIQTEISADIKEAQKTIEQTIQKMRNSRDAADQIASMVQIIEALVTAASGIMRRIFPYGVSAPNPAVTAPNAPPTALNAPPNALPSAPNAPGSAPDTLDRDMRTPLDLVQNPRASADRLEKTFDASGKERTAERQKAQNEFDTAMLALDGWTADPNKSESQNQSAHDKLVARVQEALKVLRQVNVQNASPRLKALYQQRAELMAQMRKMEASGDTAGADAALKHIADLAPEIIKLEQATKINTAPANEAVTKRIKELRAEQQRRGDLVTRNISRPPALLAALEGDRIDLTYAYIRDLQSLPGIPLMAKLINSLPATMRTNPDGSTISITTDGGVLRMHNAPPMFFTQEVTQSVGQLLRQLAESTGKGVTMTPKERMEKLDMEIRTLRQNMQKAAEAFNKSAGQPNDARIKLGRAAESAARALYDLAEDIAGDLNLPVTFRDGAYNAREEAAKFLKTIREQIATLEKIGKANPPSPEPVGETPSKRLDAFNKERAERAKATTAAVNAFNANRNNDTYAAVRKAIFAERQSISTPNLNTVLAGNPDAPTRDRIRKEVNQQNDNLDATEKMVEAAWKTTPEGQKKSVEDARRRLDAFNKERAERAKATTAAVNAFNANRNNDTYATFFTIESANPKASKDRAEKNLADLQKNLAPLGQAGQDIWKSIQDAINNGNAVPVSPTEPIAKKNDAAKKKLDDDVAKKTLDDAAKKKLDDAAKKKLDDDVAKKALDDAAKKKLDDAARGKEKEAAGKKIENERAKREASINTFLDAVTKNADSSDNAREALAKETKGIAGPGLIAVNVATYRVALDRYINALRAEQATINSNRNLWENENHNDAHRRTERRLGAVISELDRTAGLEKTIKQTEDKIAAEKKNAAESTAVELHRKNLDAFNNERMNAARITENAVDAYSNAPDVNTYEAAIKAIADERDIISEKRVKEVLAGERNKDVAGSIINQTSTHRLFLNNIADRIQKTWKTLQEGQKKAEYVKKQAEEPVKKAEAPTKAKTESEIAGLDAEINLLEAREKERWDAYVRSTAEQVVCLGVTSLNNPKQAAEQSKKRIEAQNQTAAIGRQLDEVRKQLSDRRAIRDKLKKTLGQ